MMITYEGDNARVERQCPFCGEVSEITVPAVDFEAWASGELIQNAMWYLTPANREFLISGICRDCQEKIFADQVLTTRANYDMMYT